MEKNQNNNHEKHLTKVEEKEIKIYTGLIEEDVSTIKNRQRKTFKTLSRYNNGDDKDTVKNIFKEIIKSCEAIINKLN